LVPHLDPAEPDGMQTSCPRHHWTVEFIPDAAPSRPLVRIVPTRNSPSVHYDRTARLEFIARLR